MRHLHELGLVEALNEKVLNGKAPVLGICLGMQLLTKRSEEGELQGLGWIDGWTMRFRFDERDSGLKIPHMGWNTVRPLSSESLFHGLDEQSRFYFVHSYHVQCAREEDVLAMTCFGYEFASAVQMGNVMGTQFHPEKSHNFGMKLLTNFCQWSRPC